MTASPRRHEQQTTNAHSVTGNRRQWASLLVHAAEDAAITRRQLTDCDRKIAELQDVNAIPWYWERDEHELQFILYFSRSDATNLVAFELVKVDDEPPSPHQRLRFENELQMEAESASTVYEGMVTKAAESFWPLRPE